MWECKGQHRKKYRFDLAVRQIVGKRLTWAEVTGKVMETSLRAN